MQLCKARHDGPRDRGSPLWEPLVPCSSSSTASQLKCAEQQTINFCKTNYILYASIISYILRKTKVNNSFWRKKYKLIWSQFILK